MFTTPLSEECHIGGSEMASAKHVETSWAPPLLPGSFQQVPPRIYRRRLIGL
jgi:hypothetical protein